MDIKDQVKQVLEERPRALPWKHPPERDLKRYRTGIGFIVLAAPCTAIGLASLRLVSDPFMAAIWLAHAVLLILFGAWMIDRSTKTVPEPKPEGDTAHPAQLRRVK